VLPNVSRGGTLAASVSLTSGRDIAGSLHLKDHRSQVVRAALHMCGGYSGTRTYAETRWSLPEAGAQRTEKNLTERSVGRDRAEQNLPEAGARVHQE